MLTLRSFRRRGLGLLLKSILVVCVFVIFIQITSSHPRGGNYPQQEESNHVNVQKSHGLGILDVVQNVGDNVVNRQEAHSHSLQKIPAVNEQNVLEQHIVNVRPTRPSREREFYENIIIHFDLKGAPPKIPYFKEMLRLVAKAGATGVLIEWEDMFPWTGALESARNTDAYSLDNIKDILREATSLNLDVIPLVQTFGHLEWLLKLEQFRHLRENEAYPQVVCLGDAEGAQLVKEALKQVIDVHQEFGIPYFHIGADEAFEFGVCEKSRDWISKHGLDGGRQALALNHLRNISKYVQNYANTTVLAWHDMLKDFDGRLIKKLDLAKYIQPVVWDYSENIVTMNDWSFSSLAENFDTIWASSAYKGANFPSAKYIDIRHYEANNNAWIKTKLKQQQKFKKFGGIIITGWQRYDHMAALCEILPMGTPSMVLQIQIALMGDKADSTIARQRAGRILECQSYSVNNLELISNTCKFPGSLIYMLFQGTARQTISHVEDQLGSNHHIMGWLSPYSMKHNFTQNWYLKEIEPIVNGLYQQLNAAENNLRKEMSNNFYDNTIDEFLYLTMAPTTDKLKKMVDETKRLKAYRVYPKRHFKIER